jgi:signal transduction histidine kinase
LQESQPVVIPDFSSQLPPSPAAWLAAMPTYIGVPIQVKGKKMGVLSIFNPAVPQPAAEKIALLSAIGYQIGITVENARLRERGERAAVIEDRQRLARDLHDSVTQSLYGVTLFVQASRGSIQEGDLSLTRQHIEQLSETAQQALKEMRLLIFQLRPSLLEQVGLIGALQQRLAVVEQRAGVETQFQVEGALELPAALENDLYQIAQEALNNILKHAAATRVVLRLIMDEYTIYLAIEDNGQGFDLQTVSATAGIGLASMSERAQRIGAQLEIESSPNAGTRVRLTMPRGETR